MDEDLKKLRKVVKFMQKEGILALKMDGIELSLDRGALKDPEPEAPEAPSAASPTIPTDTMTEEDILFWSVPGLPAEPAEMN